MKRVMAFVLAGGRTRGLSVLSQPRSVAALPFGGKYRLIDFTLSNCVNSEIYHVGVLTQYAPLSLAKHIGRGDPWDLNRREGGVRILQPYARQEGARWYEGTADALRQNLNVLIESGAEHVFVLSGDLVYKMDYSWMLRSHMERGSQVTLGVGRPPYGEVWRFGMVELGADGSIREFTEKPSETTSDTAFMGVYLFEAAYLIDILRSSNGANLILDVLRPRLTDPAVASTYLFEGSWDDVGDLPRYFRASQRLLGPNPTPHLADPAWRVFTRSEEMAPVWIRNHAHVDNSVIANGAIVQGQVERSILSPGVVVAKGAVVRDSILFNGCVVGPGAQVERAVLDKSVTLGDGCRVGGPVDSGSVLPEHEGITAVGKWANLESGRVVAAGDAVPGGDPLAPEAQFARISEAVQ